MEHAEQRASKAEQYHPRMPEYSPSWHLLSKHFDRFPAVYDETFSKEYGFYRPVVTQVVKDCLKCGDLKEGFRQSALPRPPLPYYNWFLHSGGIILWLFLLNVCFALQN